MRKSFLMILISLLSISTINAQSVSLESFGINPREVAMDTLDIFDTVSNGLLNVGKETKMYLKGSSSVALNSAVWTLISKPATSASTLGTATVADTSTQFVIFTPDVVGTYMISFVDGSAGDTITVNAGTFLGMDGGSVSCVTCHNSTATNYMATGHATATKDQFDALSGHSTPFFGEACLECHATGFNPNASNDGFDDFSFVFPAAFGDGVYDATKTAYPEAMARADIQCEACHGPGSEHMANVSDNKMVASLASDNCASCHEDNGTHHWLPSQWNASGHDATDFDERGFHGGHAVGAFVGYAGGRNGCAACHSGSGYVLWDKEGKPVDGNGLPSRTSYVPEGTNISCATCHDPHDGTSIHQLRLSDTQLGDGTPVTFEKYGTGAQCMECHRSRRYAKEYASNPASGSSHFGPHHGPQADMLIGANAPDFGVKFPTSPHALLGNSCVDCHMSNAGGSFDDNGDVVLVGGHSFNMNDHSGNDNVKVCESCHGDVGATFKEKQYFMNGMADHDGDGAVEGLQEEVHGMLATLATYLPQKDDGSVDMSSKTNSPAIVRAGYAYMWVEEDRSFGIHNPAFTVALLQVAMESMKYGAITSGKIVNIDDILNDQGYQVRLVWTAFGSDDGIAKDQVESYTILRQAPVGAADMDRSKFSSFKNITGDLENGALLNVNDELWDVVATVPAIRYTEYAAVVPTLANTVEGDTVLSTFKVIGKTAMGMQAETAPMSGYSVDNLVPTAPGGVAIELDDMSVVLNWNEPVDADFNFFEIYKSDSQGFVPTEDKLIGTTVENTFADANTALGSTYFYKILATDFSKNRSDASSEVNVTITDVDDLGNLPTEYSLNQNYPNPFNPSTTIKFGLPETADVQVVIYDMVGNMVEVLVNNNLSAGYHTFNWNATNRASGIYFCQMTTGKFTSVNKMLLIK